MLTRSKAINKTWMMASVNMVVEKKIKTKKL